MASQPHINQLLEPVQLESVLTTFLQSKSVKLLRVIAATGRSKVTWLYYECNLTGRKRATFVSFADLIRIPSNGNNTFTRTDDRAIINRYKSGIRDFNNRTRYGNCFSVVELLFCYWSYFP